VKEIIEKKKVGVYVLVEEKEKEESE